MNKYLDFWYWFNKKEKDFFYTIEEKADKWVPLIDQELKKIHPDIVFEISELIKERREFIISADGNYDAFDDVFKLCDESLFNDKWQIIALRQPENVSNHQVELDGLLLGYEDIFYTLNNNDIQVYIKGYDHIDQRYVHAYFLLLDSLIGEYDAVTKINKTTLLHEMNDDLKPFINLIEDIKKESTKS